MTKICFVCLGNICRSTMAEAVMQNLSKHIVVESRGTSNWEHGNPIHPGTRRTLTAKGIPYNPNKGSQQIGPDDFAYFDYIIGMDSQNVKDLQQMAPDAFSYKIYQFESESVPDPYYTGDFEDTYERVNRGCRAWLTRLDKD